MIYFNFTDFLIVHKISYINFFFRSIAKEATLSSVSKKKSGKDSIVSSSDVEKLGRLATEIKSSEGVPDPSRDGKGLIFKRIQAHKSGPFDFEDIKVISIFEILELYNSSFHS